MTTVHATTATQKTVDGPSHSKLPIRHTIKHDVFIDHILQRTGEEVEVLPLTSSLLPLVLLRWVEIAAVC